MGRAIRIIVLAAALAVPGAGQAGSVDFSRIAEPYPFENLPGVRPPPDELKGEIVCHTELRQDRRGGFRRGYAVRVYVCPDGTGYYEGTEPPREDEWRKIRQRRGS